jgi:iron complex outermembrane receptor protein
MSYLSQWVVTQSRRSEKPKRRAAAVFLATIASLSGGWACGQSAAQPAAAADTGLDEIIVTARQRKESLETTPVSVTAINVANLEETHAITIQDISGAVPNLFIQKQPSGGEAAAIAIRGIAFADIEDSFDPAVGVVIDGVYAGTNTGQLLDFFDVASIEVLRGPQGTLFGRNTTAGVINVRRTLPTGEYDGHAEVSYGNYATSQEKGVVNMPIIKDVLALKLFEDHTNTNGFVHDVTTGTYGPKSTTDNFGAALLYTPSASFQGLLTLEAQAFNGTTENSSGSITGFLVCRAAPAVQCNRNYSNDLYTNFSQFPTPSNYTSPAATMELTQDLGGNFKLKSITGWRNSTELYRTDYDATSIPFYETIRDQYYRQFSQEFRVSGNITDTLDIVSGLYYFNSRYDIHQTTLLGPLLGNRITNEFAGQTSKSYAGYADLDWQFLQQFRLSLGGRMTHDEKIFNNAFPGSFSANASDDWNKFTPKVSVDYRPNSVVMLYASFAEGYRAGGFNGRAATLQTSVTPYQPETVDSYEFGVKMETADRRLAFNAAAFYSKYNNKQESIIQLSPPGSPTPNETVVANAAAAKIYGFETELTVRPIQALTLNLTSGYLDSHYESFETLNAKTLKPIDLSGLSLIFNPKWTASASARYEMPTPVGMADFTGSYRHIASYFTSIAPDPSNANPSAPTLNYLSSKTKPYDPVDLSVGLKIDQVALHPSVNLYVRNLLDDRGESTETVVGGLFASVTPRDPRTFGVELGVKF